MDPFCNISADVRFRALLEEVEGFYCNRLEGRNFVVLSSDSNFWSLPVLKGLAFLYR